MKLKKMLIIGVFFLIPNILLTQTHNKNTSEILYENTNEQETDGDLKLRNAEGEIVFQMIQENNSNGISFFIPPISSIESYSNKLYNLNNTLHWNNIPLIGGTGISGWSVHDKNLVLEDSIQFVGIGTVTPEHELHMKNGSIYVEGEEAWFPGLTIKNNSGRSVLQLHGRSGGISSRSSEIILRDYSNNSNWSLLNAESNVLIFMSSVDGINKTPFKLELGAPTNSLTVNSKGNVGIGAWSSEHKLAVAGSIISEEVVVKLQADWPDYVFDDNYTLQDLSEVEEYVKVNNHLKGIPSADEIKKKGMSIAEIQIKLLEKIEELTLYLIEQDKSIESLKAEIDLLKRKHGEI